MKKKLLNYLRLTRMHSPAGMLLLLWPTLWGLWLAAKGFPGGYWLTIFILGVVVMRALGCVINDIADRRLDAQVQRTKTRPLAGGEVSLLEAAAVAFVLLVFALALWWRLPLAAKQWAVLAFIVAVFYPLSKRFFAAPQAVLGAAFGFGIPIAFAAVLQSHPPTMAWLFFLANALWVFAYDTVYAMADKEDDLQIGIKSAAILFADNTVAVVSVLYVAAVLWLSFLGIVFNFGVAYQVALLACMLIVFRFWRLYRMQTAAACLAAFRQNHWFGAFVFAGLVAAFA